MPSINFEDIGVSVKEGDTITFKYNGESKTDKIKNIRPGRVKTIKIIEFVNDNTIAITCNAKTCGDFDIYLTPFVEPPLSNDVLTPADAERPPVAERPADAERPPVADLELSSDSEEESSSSENEGVEKRVTIPVIQQEIKKVESPFVLGLVEKYNAALTDRTGKSLRGVICLPYIEDTCASFESSFGATPGYIDLNMGKVLLILTIRLQSIGIKMFEEIGIMIDEYISNRKTSDSVKGFKHVLVLYFKQFALKQKNEQLVFKSITDIFNSIYDKKNIEKEKAIIKSIEIILDQKEKEKNARLKALKIKEIKKEQLKKMFLRQTRNSKLIKDDRNTVESWTREFLSVFLASTNTMISEIKSGTTNNNATGTETFYKFDPIYCFNNKAKKANILKNISIDPHFSFWGNFNQRELARKPKDPPLGFTDGRDFIGFGYHISITLPSGSKCYFRLQSTARFITKDLYGQWGPDETSLVFDITDFPVDDLNSHVMLNRQRIGDDHYLEGEMNASLDELKEKTSKINQTDFAVLNVILDHEYQFIEKMATLFLLLREEFILWINDKSIYDESDPKYQPKYYFTKFGGTKRRQNRKTRNKKNRKTRKHLNRSK